VEQLISYVVVFHVGRNCTFASSHGSPHLITSGRKCLLGEARRNEVISHTSVHRRTQMPLQQPTDE
jgi:hypothetical protein